jgi:hypothetical protein
MSDSLNRLKLEKKGLARQQQVILAVNTLVDDIGRCEKTITELKTELEAVNVKHQGRRTTRDDIAYLTDLLECAKKKLNWEKHMASLQKRTPEILQEMSALINDPKNPPPDQVRAEMLRALQGVQAAMEQLHGVKVD